MQLVGYSTPSKIHLEPNAILWWRKWLRKHRSRHAQRGDYACLVQRAGNTGHQGIAVEPRLLDLSMHKNTGKTQSITTQAKQVQCTNTWWHDILMHWNLTNKLNGVQTNYFDKRRLIPIFNLMFSLLPTKVKYYKCVQTCMEMMLMDGSYYSEHFDVLNTFSW